MQPTTANAVHGFDVAMYKQHLGSRDMGRALMVTPSISSTQEFMRQHTTRLPEGAVLVAEQQFAGKGARAAADRRLAPARLRCACLVRRRPAQGGQPGCC